MWLWLKTAVFSVFVPGVVAILIPSRLAEDKTYHLWSLAPGLVLVAFGVCTYLWCASTFVRTGHGTPAPIDEPKRFVAVGPYVWSRNPMYVAVLTAILGQALIFLSWYIVLYAAIAFLIVELFVTQYEEPHLRKKFGTEYEEYLGRTPRWIGR